MNNIFGGNVPTLKQLWKDEPSKFRQWIILFGIILFVTMTLSITSFILVLLNQDNIQNSLSKSWSSLITNEAQRVGAIKSHVLGNYIVMPGLVCLLSMSALILYIITTIKSYKLKSFSKISSYSVYISEFIGFMAIFDIVSAYRSIIYTGNNVALIIALVVKFLSVTMLIFAMQVSKIRKSFLGIERIEQMQNNPEFQQMQEQMKQFFNQAQSGQSYHSPFGTPVTPTPNDVKKEKNKESKEVTQLKKLKIEELRNIAKKLSISGSEKMKKEELIKFIIRATQEG